MTVIASIIPFVLHLSKPTPESRILAFFLGFSVCFVILSISSEGLFYFSYASTLFVWVEVETVLRAQKQKLEPKGPVTVVSYRLQMDDLRIAVFFLFFVQVGFFGTGK